MDSGQKDSTNNMYKMDMTSPDHTYLKNEPIRVYFETKSYKIKINFTTKDKGIRGSSYFCIS